VRARAHQAREAKTRTPLPVRTRLMNFSSSLARWLRPAMVGTAALAAAFTVVVNVTNVDVAYHASDAHVAIETAAALVCLLVAFIVVGRFVQSGRFVESRRLSDLLLAAALLTLGSVNLVFAAIPAVTGSSFSRWSVWAQVAGRVLGAALLAAAACAPQRRVQDPRGALIKVLASTVWLLVAIGVVFAFLAPDLPLGIDPALSPTASADGLTDNPGLLAVQFVTFMLYSVAAVRFMVSAERARDPLLGWVAVASVLGAFAALNYAIYPSLYSEWVYTGDILRGLFFVVLLLGAAREIQRYQRGLASAAALEERRRLARELHDGLAQELAFIATQTRWLARTDESQRMDQLVVAAQRALDESRSAISALTRPIDEPLDAALAQAAEDVAARVGVRLKLDLAEQIQVPPTTRTALVRIVREAVSNTARHGQASCVTVVLTNRDGVRVSVRDDGIGFDPSARDQRGFGLTSIGERVHALGAELIISSSPAEGTHIEVVLP
jgi:signal transduction histidine kinase